MTPELARARDALIRDLSREVADPRVLEAVRSVPRERFVPEQLHRFAYDNRALPIDEGQTISQPLMVAIMTEALQLTGDEHALEVGTGSGYQAAILARLAKDLVTVERLPELARSAAERLAALHCDNVRVYAVEEGLGYPQEAPYDAIIVTAGAPHVPRSLLDQLAEGGRLVLPVGDRDVQQLVRVTRQDFGVSLEQLGECRFVPLIAADAWPERPPASTNGASAV